MRYRIDDVTVTWAKKAGSSQDQSAETIDWDKLAKHIRE